MTCSFGNVTIRSYPLELRAHCGCGFTASQSADAPTFPYELARSVAAHLGWDVSVLPSVDSPRPPHRLPAMFCHGLGWAAERLAQRHWEAM